MTRFTIVFSPQAQDDFDAFARAGEKKLIKKIGLLLDDIAQHPTTGIGKPEALKHGYSGCWSREINRKHRIVYTIDHGRIVVLVMQMRQHYDDK